MQGSAHLTVRSLGITQADGALLRDSPALLERIKTLEPRNPRQRLEKALTTYEDFYSGKTPFRIVVVGSQGVGKSNFVNNFLGTKQPLLPSQRGGRAVTLAPTIITYGENYRLSVFPTSYSPDLSFSQEEPLFQALHALQQKQQQEALPNHLNRVRNELKKVVEHQEEMDKLEEKLGRAKVEKSKKKLGAELEELSRARPKFELDFEREIPEKEPLERIMITVPNSSLKGIEIVDCPGYSDKSHDARLVAPMLRDAHCLAVIAARLPSRLEFYDALERNCMASSLLVVWRWPDESEERRQKSLSDMPAVMEQAYHKRFMEERRLPFNAEQLIRCSSMRSFLTEFDHPKLDWVMQAREHHLEKLAEWLVACLQAVETPLPRPPSLDQASLMLGFQRIIQTVVAFYEPTRLSNLTRDKMKLVTSILENVTRQARDTVFHLVAQSVTPEKQELLRVALMIDSLSVPPFPNNIQTTLYEEMIKIWPANVIQAIAVGREQTNRDKSLQAGFDADALCRKFSSFIEAALRSWFLDLVKLIS